MLRRAVPCYHGALPDPDAPAAQLAGCTEDVQKPGCIPCPQHPVGVQRAWLAPRRHAACQSQPSLQREPLSSYAAQPCSASRIYVPWPQRATAQGHTTDTSRTRAALPEHPTRRETPHLEHGCGCCRCYNPGGPSPRLRTAGPPASPAPWPRNHLPCPAAPGAGVHQLHAHPWCASSNAHTEHLLTLQACREGWRPAAWLLGWKGSSFRLPAAARILSSTSFRLVFRRVLPRQGGSGTSPGRLAWESRVPHLAGRFPSPHSSLLPCPSHFGRKTLIFLDRTGASFPRPRSCEQLRSCLALYT